jgi:hypothetical protein
VVNACAQVEPRRSNSPAATCNLDHVQYHTNSNTNLIAQCSLSRTGDLPRSVCRCTGHPYCLALLNDFAHLADTVAFCPPIGVLHLGPRKLLVYCTTSLRFRVFLSTIYQVAERLHSIVSDPEPAIKPKEYWSVCICSGWDARDTRSILIAPSQGIRDYLKAIQSRSLSKDWKLVDYQTLSDAFGPLQACCLSTPASVPRQ